MNSKPCSISRREFVSRTALAAAGAALALEQGWGAETAPFSPPLAVFSKVYQELKLDFDQAGALTADAGLDGVDTPVRPGGEILPERATEDLPRYAEALRRHKKDVLLLTTAILGPATPHTEDILRTAKKLGVRYYRLGFVPLQPQTEVAKELVEAKARLRELAALNRELGLTAVFQNHSAVGRSRYLGGNLSELYEIVKDFPPEQIGVAFDLGHALIMHGQEWSSWFEKLKSHVQVAYVKDTDPGRRFVRFGEGEFSRTDWFSRLKAMHYRAPFSIHIEFDWTGPDKRKTREAMVKSLQECVATLRQWISKA